MNPLTPPSLWQRAWTLLPFIASAALAAALLRALPERPWLTLLALLGAGLVYSLQRRARARAARLLTSGDVRAMFDAWDGALEELPNAATFKPLIAATTFAANGYTEQARAALARAERGPAWDSALEHRLLVETLVDAFDGERQRALERATELVALPLPAAGPFTRARIATLRDSALALARAFARRSLPNDQRDLEAASRSNPLIHWALRYAAAIAALDGARPERVEPLLEGAPAWPEDSAFSGFDVEIRARAVELNPRA